jgi:hypothetical protein
MVRLYPGLTITDCEIEALAHLKNLSHLGFAEMVVYPNSDLFVDGQGPDPLWKSVMQVTE